MRMRALAAAGLVLGLVAPAAAQEPVSATTEAGQAVLLFADGTWKYKEAPSTPTPGLKKWSKPASATDRLTLGQGKAQVSFDPRKWKRAKADEPGTQELSHLTGDGYSKIICERIQIPITALRRVVLENAKEVAADARVVFEEKRLVNGNEVLCMQMKGSTDGIQFVFFGYYYSGKEGSIQVITFTSENLFDEYKKDFEELLNGFEIVK